MTNEEPHDIVKMEELEKLFSKEEISEKYTPIPEVELKDIMKMNRKERRKWISQKRKAIRDVLNG